MSARKQERKKGHTHGITVSVSSIKVSFCQVLLLLSPSSCFQGTTKLYLVPRVKPNLYCQPHLLPCWGVLLPCLWCDLCRTVQEEIKQQINLISFSRPSKNQRLSHQNACEIVSILLTPELLYITFDKFNQRVF